MKICYLNKTLPGSRTLWNLPILSTTQASCWGTNMTAVLRGVVCFQRAGTRPGTASAAENWSWPRTVLPT